MKSCGEIAEDTIFRLVILNMILAVDLALFHLPHWWLRDLGGNVISRHGPFLLERFVTMSITYGGCEGDLLRIFHFPQLSLLV